MNEGAVRRDEAKTRLDLISPIFIEHLGKVLTQGAEKYSDHNWRGGMRWSRSIASLKRHLNMFESGIDYDSESGLLHLAHVAANTMFLLEYVFTHPELDDRYKYEK